MAHIWALLDWCFFGPPSVGPGRFAPLLRLLRYPYAVSRDLAHGEINLRAMGLVYTTLLSLIPLLVFTFAVLKSIEGARRELEPILYDFFTPLGEQGAQQLTRSIMQFADRVSNRVVGSVGFVLLAWTLVGTIKKVEDSFNFLWRVEQPRSLARRIVEYLTLLIFGPVLLVSFVSLSEAALRSVPVQEVVQLPLLQRLSGSALKLAPYAMVSAFFTALYMLIPNTRVHWRPALIGALVAGVLWAAVGKMFTAFVVYSTRLTLIYAGFALIVAALLWTYSGWLILLAGAQLSFYIQNPAYLRLGFKELRLSGEEREQLALQVMYLIGQAHMAGDRLWTTGELATEQAVPLTAMARTTAALVHAGLLLTTADGKLVPARDIGQIRALEVLDVARTESGGYAPRSTQFPPVDRLLTAIDEARRHRFGELTLRDLVEEPPRTTLPLEHTQGLLEQE